ncbi:hypothetical protein D3C76_1719710 [compost metagenome]
MGSATQDEFFQARMTKAAHYQQIGAGGECFLLQALSDRAPGQLHAQRPSVQASVL